MIAQKQNNTTNISEYDHSREWGMVSRYGEKITLKGEQYHYGKNSAIVFVNYNNVKKITKVKRITLKSNVVTIHI